MEVEETRLAHQLTVGFETALREPSLAAARPLLEALPRLASDRSVSHQVQDCLLDAWSDATEAVPPVHGLRCC